MPVGRWVQLTSLYDFQELLFLVLLYLGYLYEEPVLWDKKNTMCWVSGQKEVRMRVGGRSHHNWKNIW